MPKKKKTLPPVKLQEFKLNDLKPAEYNPREIEDEALKGLRASIQEHGYLEPIIVNVESGEPVIVGGHQRQKALIADGYETAQCIVVNKTLIKEKAANVSLNSGEISGSFINDLLKPILEELAINYDKYEDLRLDKLKESLDINYDFEEEEDNNQADEVPDTPEKTVIKDGDLVRLGEHFVLCGDSTKREDVELLMGGEKADMCFTSPPYNAGSFGFTQGKDKYKNKQGDSLSDEEYYKLLTDSTSLLLDVADYCFVNLQLLANNKKVLMQYQHNYISSLKDVFIWLKSTASPNINKGVFSCKYEYIYCFSQNDAEKRGFPVDWQGKYTNVIEGANAGQNEFADIHSATFPAYLPIWFIEKFDFVKSVVDVFGGTGTTLIACEKLKRKCFMMELDPVYISVIISRWVQYTGIKQVMINDKVVNWDEYSGLK